MKESLRADQSHPRRRLRCRPPRGTAAFSLVELMVALAVLSIVLLAFGATVAASTTQRTVAEERRAAEQALSSFHEQLRSMDLSAVAATQVGTTTPSVPGLTNVTRTLVLYRDEAGPGATEVDHDALAFPVDLNGDGDTDDGEVPVGDCLIIPARLSLTWTSAAQQTLEVRLYVYLSSF